MCAKKEKIYPVYVSKHNSNREKQVIPLMISNGEKGHKAKSEGRRRWHYLAAKKLSALLRGINSNHHGDFYFLNCFHSFETENKLQLHKRVCENKDFKKILEFNQYQKSDNAQFIIYPDLECIAEKIDGWKDNPENSSTTKVSEHIP